MDPQSTPPTDAKTTARRRLLRGSFSVPAVLAVHNGSALAARSNQFRCAVNAVGGSGTLPAETWLSNTTDKWVRVPVYKCTRISNGKSVAFEAVKVQELSAIASARSLGFVAPTGTDTGWATYASGGGYAYCTAPASSSDSGKRAAVLFKNYGTSSQPNIKVVGFVQPGQTTGSGHGGIMASCWTSIAT